MQVGLSSKGEKMMKSRTEKRRSLLGMHLKTKSTIRFRPGTIHFNNFLMALIVSFALCTTAVRTSQAQTLYGIGGTVSGLTAGGGLVLRNNGGPALTINSDGVFIFPAMLPDSATYDVTLTVQPASENCAVANPTGTVIAAYGDVTTVWVSCQPIISPPPPPSRWTPLANKSPLSVGPGFLLSDGSVLLSGPSQGQAASSGQRWIRLIPDSSGHYVKGTFLGVRNSNCPHGDFASQMLTDGRLFVAGGEYPKTPSGLPGCSGPSEVNSGVDTEIYDPVADQWTSADPPTSLIDPTQSTHYHSIWGKQGFDDMVSEILPDGSVLMAPVDPKNCGDTLIFNPKSFTPSSPGSGWSFGGMLANTVNTLADAPYTCDQQEATWVKLQDGSILTADPPAYLGATETSERYLPLVHRWARERPLGFSLFDMEYGYNGHGEEGPAFLLPNGDAMFIGGAPAMGFYTPTTGLWTIRGTILNGPTTGSAPLAADDAPGAMMVDGRILLTLNYAATPHNSVPSPVFFYVYDSNSGAFTEVRGPGNPSAPSIWTDCGPSWMLDLPDGTVLMPSGCDSTELYVYQPSGSPLKVGRPHINTISNVSYGTYRLAGTGLNGLSEGASYGDDSQMASNYPLVRLTDHAGNVTYARTHDWSSTSVMTGLRPMSTEFTLPASILQAFPQTYSLEVVANGNPSAPVCFSASPLARCP
jgi:hypothetical protein